MDATAPPSDLYSRQDSTLGAPLDVRIGGAVFAGIHCWFAARWGKHVGIRIVGGIAGNARSYFENDGDPCGSVLQTVAIWIAGFEAGTVTGSQQFGSTIGDKGYFAREYIYELIRSSLPMTLARPCARRQAEKIHTELSEACGVTQFGSRPGEAGLVIGRRVPRTYDGCQRSDMNFSGHETLRFSWHPLNGTEGLSFSEYCRLATHERTLCASDNFATP
jgi:hypothetical protein